MAALAALGTLFWNDGMNWLTERGVGEPAHALEGVSLWPAEAIRLCIVALAIAFLIRSHRRLQINRRNITLDFALPREQTGRDEPPPRSLLARTKAFLADVRECLRESFIAEPEVNPGNVESLWAFYLRDGRACARWCRVICLVVLFTALALCAFAIWPDFVRFRGSLSFTADRWLFYACVLTFNFLLFYVVDALVICTRCVRRLAAGLQWPSASAAKFAARYGANTPLDEWMSVQIVARRTEAVGRLVYMPFILLFLIIVARNSVFERWTFAPSVIALLTASAALIVLAAWRLRETTETVRTNALESLTDRLIEAQGAGGKGVQQIQLLIAEVRELRKGAFAPYTDQTFIRALLLPLAGYATSALIEYLSLVRP